MDRRTVLVVRIGVRIIMMVVIARMLMVFVVTVFVVMSRFLVIPGLIGVMLGVVEVFVVVIFLGVSVNLLQPLCGRPRARLDDFTLNPFAMATPARVAMA